MTQLDGDWPVLYSDVCLLCRNFVADASLVPGDERCRAFPDGIPRPIWNGENRHTKPFPGDHGIRFEKLDGR